MQRHVRRWYQDEKGVLQSSFRLHSDHDQVNRRRVCRSQATGGGKMLLGALLVEQNVNHVADICFFFLKLYESIIML